jgi:hypothetical protein
LALTLKGRKNEGIEEGVNLCCDRG